MSATTLTAMSRELPAVTDSLDAYLARISQVPLLSAEAEQTLARRWWKEQDLDAARELVLSNLRFVAHIARGYRGYGLPQADLIQEGNIGLMKAVKRFDPDVGVRLVSFAVHWIKAEIHEYILRNWRIVKVATTKAQRKLFFHLRSAKQRLGWFNQEEAETVAQELGVPTETVWEMEARLSGQDIGLDPLMDSDDEASHRAPLHFLAAPDADPADLIADEDWTRQTHADLQAALGELDARSRDVLFRRWAQEPKATLHELAASHGVSAERIRQIEANALRKLRASLAA
ncbi:MAG: RNA polymerase sigma factor [Pseudomonadota bacterium]|jgi:RNA polymerase sigma-32 factor